MSATPNQEIPSMYVEKDKIADGTPCVSHSPFNRADFCGEGTGHFKNNANRLLFQKAKPIQPRLKTRSRRTNEPPLWGSCFNSCFNQDELFF